LDEKNVKSGEAKSRDAAKVSVVWLIDKTLALKKVKLAPPAKPPPPDQVMKCRAAFPFSRAFVGKLSRRFC
jgi:hypothetical protein